MGRLQDKVAFLTGAGAGIAKATAKAFVKEGASVAVIEISREAGQSAEREIREAGGDAVFIEMDATIARFGRLDVIFNCAGGSLQEDVPVHEMDLDVWNRTIALNLLHPFLTCRYAIPHMMKQGAGSIINVT